MQPVEPPKPTGPRPEYKVDRDFEERAIQERESKPKKSRKPVLIVLAICAVIVIAALAVSFFLPGDGAEQESTPPESGAPVTDNVVVPPASASAEPETTPTPTLRPPRPEPHADAGVYI